MNSTTTNPRNPSSPPPTTTTTNNNNNNQTRTRTKPPLFFLPKTKKQFQILVRRLTLQCCNLAFLCADKFMYLLGPILICLASAIIVGLCYVYFKIVLPMLSKTNWVVTFGDLNDYKNDNDNNSNSNNNAIIKSDNNDASSFLQPMTPLHSIMLALSTPTGIIHTLFVIFLLVNVLYNYYKCVTTSNSHTKNPMYDRAIRELAAATGFVYPETEEEMKKCKKEMEQSILERVERRRREMRGMLSAGNNNGVSSSNVGNGVGGNGVGANASGENAALAASNTTNGDVESQTALSVSPLMATSPTYAATTTSTSVTHTNATSTTKNNSNNNNKPPPQKLPRIHNWQLLSPTEWTYCRNTSQPKPPRSHYDHVTKSLVLNMDHYCPWMFNAIGYFNYRYFFNFLWFVVLGMGYGACVICPLFLNLGGELYREQVRESSSSSSSPFNPGHSRVKHLQSNPYIPTPEERTPVAFGFMICLSVGAAVLCLAVFHLYLVLSAQTTIEFHGNWSKRRKKNGWKNPYSVGWKGNWKMVYGSTANNSGTSSRRTCCSKSKRKKQKEEDGDNNNNDGGQYHRSCGCWGVLMAMMPSNREPEFLPIPINGALARRKKYNKKVDLDIEASADTDAALSNNRMDTGGLIGRAGRSTAREDDHIV